MFCNTSPVNLANPSFAEDTVSFALDKCSSNFLCFPFLSNVSVFCMFKYIEDRTPSLKELQKYVGGSIAKVTLKNGDTLVFNEDGIRLGLRANQEATTVYKKNGGMRTNFIRGYAVIVKMGLMK